MYITRRKNKTKYKLLFFISFILISIITISLYIDQKMMPVVRAVAELKAQEITTRAVNEAVSSVIENGLEYSDFYYFKEDSEGYITMMQSDTIVMNKVASAVGIAIQDNLRKADKTTDKIPLATALDSPIFSQYGPKVKVTVSPRGMVDVNFGSRFEQMGINQVRHTVFLTIDLTVRVIVPFDSNTMKISSVVPLTDNIIVGRVPQSYFQIPNERLFNFTPVGEE